MPFDPRGMSDARIADALRLADRLIQQLTDNGKVPVLPKHLAAQKDLLIQERALRAIGVDPSMT